MKRIGRHLLSRLLAAVVCIGIAAGFDTVSAQGRSPGFDRQTLDSMLAPIALYPDSLLSQVLMASTYPQEVDEAARWSRARSGLSGDAAVRASEGWDWDPSVRSLLAFPLVLETMAGNMRWTEDLGVAFLEQREDVMDTVQRLRRRAYQAGTLRSNEYVQVIISGFDILIEPADRSVVHVPHYDPRVVYGTWWWPSHPPVYWPRWSGYIAVPGRTHLAIHWGPGTGLSIGFFFGGFVWTRREVHVINANSYYYRRRTLVERPAPPPRPGQAPPAVRREPAPGIWRHDAARRPPVQPRESRGIEQRPAPPIVKRPPEVPRESGAPGPARVTPAPGRPPEARPERPPQREGGPTSPAAPHRSPDSGPRPPERPQPAGRPAQRDDEPSGRSAQRPAEGSRPGPGGAKN